MTASLYDLEFRVFDTQGISDADAYTYIAAYPYCDEPYWYSVRDREGNNLLVVVLTHKDRVVFVYEFQTEES